VTVTKEHYDALISEVGTLNDKYKRRKKMYRRLKKKKTTIENNYHQLILTLKEEAEIKNKKLEQKLLDDRWRPNIDYSHPLNINRTYIHTPIIENDGYDSFSDDSDDNYIVAEQWSLQSDDIEIENDIKVEDNIQKEDMFSYQHVITARPKDDKVANLSQSILQDKVAESIKQIQNNFVGPFLQTKQDDLKKDDKRITIMYDDMLDNNYRENEDDGLKNENKRILTIYDDIAHNNGTTDESDSFAPYGDIPSTHDDVEDKLSVEMKLLSTSNDYPHELSNDEQVDIKTLEQESINMNTFDKILTINPPLLVDEKSVDNDEEDIAIITDVDDSQKDVEIKNEDVDNVEPIHSNKGSNNEPILELKMEKGVKAILTTVLHKCFENENVHKAAREFMKHYNPDATDDSYKELYSLFEDFFNVNKSKNE